MGRVKKKVKICHVVPAFCNSTETIGLINHFPDATLVSLVRHPVFELQRDEPSAGQFLKQKCTLPSEIPDDEVFDVVVRSGGSPAAQFQLAGNKKIRKIFEDCWNNNGLLGTICLGAHTLAYLDLPLKGTKVTAFPMKFVVYKLRATGFDYTGNPLEVDNRIITGKVQVMTPDWIQLLKKEIKKHFGSSSTRS
jgi:putative intracellular protease/amidase